MHVLGCANATVRRISFAQYFQLLRDTQKICTKVNGTRFPLISQATLEMNEIYYFEKGKENAHTLCASGYPLNEYCYYFYCVVVYSFLHWSVSSQCMNMTRWRERRKYRDSIWRWNAICVIDIQYMAGVGVVCGACVRLHQTGTRFRHLCEWKYSANAPTSYDLFDDNDGNSSTSLHRWQ